MIDLERLNNIPDFTPPIRDRALSCAIVGNSSTILEDNLGDEIDAHDVVFRCNQAIVKDFEQHVGAKLTYRMLNSHNFWATKHDWPSRQSMCEKHERFDPDFLTKISCETIIAKRDVPPSQFKKLLSQLESNGNAVLFLKLGFHNFCDAVVNGKSASSGLVCILLALRNFKDVVCYGFRFKEGEYNHYYEKIKPYDQSCHHFDREKKVMEWLQQTGAITLR